MSTHPQYWVVGATWSGEDQLDAFFRRGYWEMGWSDKDQPGFAERRDKMKTGDRIAVKVMRGQGADTIDIRGLGIVKELAEDKRVYVEWLVTEILREVPAKGCFGTIHGPFVDPNDEDWLNRAFRL